MTDLFEKEFLGLVSRNFVEFVELLPAPDGWYLRINGFQWLPYRFDQLERTLLYLRQLGCTHVTVRLNAWPKSS
ncbi:hypothetical protein CupriaWKF_12630 [Cupriavidus sp. WKF15]|uniref:hypothetical protein n=1 Tax=Cupriavidus sp. WKF15 TaxID=3032282 RepID=UPI0023E307D4|nr:hypothetical protein [Cupriavidus sp. WKF15]WER45152.1 hypothetical protein CupriaWKF_12630 [Cupriavidus sp. WKF15]